MPKPKWLCFLLLLCTLRLYAQQATTVSLFYEKVYLHTDRDTYTQGEDIWFKAYLLDAQTSKPINYSHNLYVELINPLQKITNRLVIRLENGLGNGDFKLPDTLTAGKYRIRAYTNYMRNFGDNFVFEKSITVVGLSAGTGTIAAVKKPLKRLKGKPNLISKADTLPTGPIVRFFPEGGKMINDVQSLVSVKAEDEYGKGIPAMGQVIATSGRTVAKFTCDSLGMGSFLLDPDETQKYHAVVTIKGLQLTFKIQAAWHKGFVLSANTTPDDIIAQVSCNGFELNEASGSGMVLIATHGNKICHKERFIVKSKNALLQIPYANFPEGITCLTLYDEHSTPLCERLVYLHHANNTRMVIAPNKPVYAPKEAVTVKIKLNDTTKTHLSVAVVDAGIVPVQSENILSYLNLRSEVKGTIEHPERYFDTTNVNRFSQLDMLLLTQGWRDYVWKKIEDMPPIKYDVEQDFTVTGRVRNVWVDKPMPGLSITMFAPKAEKQKLFSATTDSAGRFTIDGALFYGRQFFSFTSRNAKQIISGKSKGKTGGWIKVDSMFQDKMAVTPLNDFMIDTTISNKALTDREITKRNFTFSGNNLLNTVKIESYTNILPPEIHPITLTEQKEYGSLMQYLLYLIPGAHIEIGNGCHMPPGAGEIPFPPVPILNQGYFTHEHTVHVSGIYEDNSFINYKTVCDNDYWGQPMDAVLKVTIHKRQTIDGVIFSVFVILRPGVLGKDVFDNTTADFVGYYRARNFYKPQYDTPDKAIQPDYRTTIYWEPNITTDAHGEATITFYNADPKTKVRIIAEGITDKGIPVAASTEYVVK